jgi:hypothetical protein
MKDGKRAEIIETKKDYLSISKEAWRLRTKRNQNQKANTAAGSESKENPYVMSFTRQPINTRFND